MITIIFGKPGSGKKALMTYFAVEMLRKGKTIWKQSEKKIKQLNEGGFEKLSPPIQKHMVFADYLITTKKHRSYDVDGYRLGMIDEKFTTAFLPPYAQIFLDEAQKYYDSRMSSYLSDRVSRFYEMHRHNNYNITLVCQRLGLIDLNVRQNAENIYLIEDFKTKYDEFGRISECHWTCIQFSCCGDAERYYDDPKTNSKLGKEVKFVCNENIFRHYNSFSCEPLFYKNKYSSVFDVDFSPVVNMDVDSVKEYTETHDYAVPTGYYKERKRNG